MIRLGPNRRLIALAGAVGALFACAVLAATAQARTFDSEITLLDADGQGTDGTAFGFIASEKRKCVPSRRVVLFAPDGDVLDRGRTSFRGLWALHVTEAEFEPGVRVKLQKSRLRNGDRCGKARDVYEPF